MSLPPDIALRSRILTCNDCGLRATCKQPVPWRTSPPGSSKVRAVWLGEAPGAEEDKTIKPFVGPAGQYLSGLVCRIKDPMGFVNVVCCRPPSNDFKVAKKEKAQERCRQNLEDQVAILDPEVVVILGGNALSSFKKGAIGEWRGKLWREKFAGKARWFSATFHPASALPGRNTKRRFGSTEKLTSEWMEQDVSMIVDVLDMLDGPLVNAAMKTFTKLEEGASFRPLDWLLNELKENKEEAEKVVMRVLNEHGGGERAEKALCVLRMLE